MEYKGTGEMQNPEQVFQVTLDYECTVTGKLKDLNLNSDNVIGFRPITMLPSSVAFASLKAGERIRRPEMAESYLCVLSELIFVGVSDPSKFPVLWLPTPEDLFAEDWEIVL